MFSRSSNILSLCFFFLSLLHWCKDHSILSPTASHYDLLNWFVSLYVIHRDMRPCGRSSRARGGSIGEHSTRCTFQNPWRNTLWRQDFLSVVYEDTRENLYSRVHATTQIGTDENGIKKLLRKKWRDIETHLTLFCFKKDTQHNYAEFTGCRWLIVLFFSLTV